MGETFIDIVGILERHKVPPDPDVRVVLDPRTWDALTFDAELLGMRVADVVRSILEKHYVPSQENKFGHDVAGGRKL